MPRDLSTFLCHTSADKQLVRELYRKLLKANGIAPWLDEENLIAGQDWDFEIRNALRQSDVVVVCLSKSSINKEGYVQKEIKHALDIAEEKPEGTIFLIPVRLEDCEVPKRLAGLHWVDLFGSNGFNRLLIALRKRADHLQLGRPRTPIIEQPGKRVVLLNRRQDDRAAEREQSYRLMEADLLQASEIQRSLLPTQPPAYDGWELAGLNLPCRAVGGDYFDFIPYGDGRLAVMVGDVAGKGLPAALLMSSLQAKVQMLCESNPSPGKAVETLNRSLTERCIPLGKFITFFYALLDPLSGVLEYSNAGHNYPFVVRKNGSVETLTGCGLVMGLFSAVHYEVKKTKLAPGDLLVLYSDGVTEAADSADVEFGDTGLAEFLAARKEIRCEDIVNQLVEHIRKWRGTPAFADDFTVVLVRRSA